MSEEFVKAKGYDKIPDVDTTKTLYASGYYGLTKVPIDMEDGSVRWICTYIPQGYYPCNDLIMLVPPANIDAESFINKTDWIKNSEKNSFEIIILEAENSTWNISDPERELQYWIAIRKWLDQREVINFGEACLYMVGYGTGAAMTHVFSMNFSTSLAGVAVFGGDDIQPEYINKVGNEESLSYSINVLFDIHEGSLKKNVKCPIWIVKETDEQQEIEKFWLKANDVEDTGLRNEFGNVFYQKSLMKDETINNRARSRVWISKFKDPESKYDFNFNETVWNEFLNKYHRFSSEPDGALRYCHKPDEIGLMEHNITYEGHVRPGLVYIPSNYNEKTSYPLVFITHGHACYPIAMEEYTEWWRVAEARGFIAVWATGHRCEEHPYSGCTLWREKDVEYVEKFLSEIFDKYNIDKSRIYLMGHSNGGTMADILASHLPMRFAAAVNVGGTRIPSIPMTGREMAQGKGEFYMPYMAMAGTHDLFDRADYEKPGTFSHENIKNWLITNGLEKQKPFIRDTGHTKHYVYYKREECCPLVEFILVRHMSHATLPEFSWMIWDQFFSAFRREEDGTLYYCDNVLTR